MNDAQKLSARYLTVASLEPLFSQGVVQVNGTCLRCQDGSLIELVPVTGGNTSTNYILNPVSSE